MRKSGHRFDNCRRTRVPLLAQIWLAQRAHSSLVKAAHRRGLTVCQAVVLMLDHIGNEDLTGPYLDGILRNAAETTSSPPAPSTCCGPAPVSPHRDPSKNGASA